MQHPWELIRTIIEESDYYVLIIGGKYGPIASDGISYTEKEFNLAVELEKPVLAFLHGEPDKIVASKVEVGNADAHQRLEQFRSRVSNLKHVKTWTNKDNLKGAVIQALTYIIRTKPAYGWVRNEGLENQELLKSLATLQERYDTLLSVVQVLRTAAAENLNTSKFMGLEAPFLVSYKVRNDENIHTVELSLSEIFFIIAYDMFVPCEENLLLQSIKPAVIEALSSEKIEVFTRTAKTSSDELNHLFQDTDIQKISPDQENSSDPKYLSENINIMINSLYDTLIQLLAIGLVEPEMVLMQSRSTGNTTLSKRCWI